MRLGLLFPGQGSQAFGMGKDFYDNSDVAKELIDASSDILGCDFKSVLFEENEKLGLTEYTQPAILLVSAIAHKLFSERVELAPTLALGHSLGEFSALVSVGALDALSGVRLVHDRGRFMSEACAGIDAGMMALIGLDDASVEAVCQEAQKSGKQVFAANFNQDGQVVVAGLKADLEATQDAFKEAGAKKSVLLKMSVASHCPLLSPAQSKLAPKLAESIQDSFSAPVISNVTTNAYATKAEALTLLNRQLIEPVKYKQSIVAVEAQVDAFIEFGQGVVLKGLNRRITKVPTHAINDMKSLEATIEKLGL